MRLTYYVSSKGPMPRTQFSPFSRLLAVGKDELQLEQLCHRAGSGRSGRCGIQCGWRGKRLGSDSDPNQSSDLQQILHIFRISSSIKGGVQTEFSCDD